jgi:predicted dienelactone hydrolase
MRRYLITTLAGLCCLSLPLIWPQPQSATAPKVPEPRAPGPYPVGVTTTVLIDTTRTDAFTKGPRTLVTEIWYPATDEARKLPKNKYSDFIPGGVTPEVEALLQRTYRLPLAELNQIFWNHAVREARVRAGTFPLIVFSHGNGGSRHQNTFWCDYLASHGYVIVSADHTANARMTIINGQVVPYQAGERSNSAADRPKDLSFLLDQMTRWQQGADKRFAGKLDLRAVTAAGMSFGSMTAIRAADLDPRFKAVIAMSGAPPDHTNLTVPSLRMLGTEDTTIGERGNALIRAHHAKHTGPSFLLELPDGGHYSFTDMFKINPRFGDGVGQGTRRVSKEPFAFTAMETAYQIINAYSVAFLGVYVKGEREYLPFLLKNHFAGDLIWQVSGVPESQMTGR